MKMNALLSRALCIRVCVSAADREGECLFWVPGQRSARERRIFHSFMPAPSHYSALSIIPLTRCVTADHRCHPDQPAASDCTATTTNTSSLQHCSICTSRTHWLLAHSIVGREPRRSLGIEHFVSRNKDPTSVFHVLQNPEISVVTQADLQSGFLYSCSAWMCIFLFCLARFCTWNA